MGTLEIEWQQNQMEILWVHWQDCSSKRMFGKRSLRPTPPDEAYSRLLQDIVNCKAVGLDTEGDPVLMLQLSGPTVVVVELLHPQHGLSSAARDLLANADIVKFTAGPDQQRLEAVAGVACGFQDIDRQVLSKDGKSLETMGLVRMWNSHSVNVVWIKPSYYNTWGRLYDQMKKKTSFNSGALRELSNFGLYAAADAVYTFREGMYQREHPECVQCSAPPHVAGPDVTKPKLNRSQIARAQEVFARPGKPPRSPSPGVAGVMLGADCRGRCHTPQCWEQ